MCLEILERVSVYPHTCMSRQISVSVCVCVCVEILERVSVCPHTCMSRQIDVCVCVRVCVRAQYFSHVGGCSVV